MKLHRFATISLILICGVLSTSWSQEPVITKEIEGECLHTPLKIEGKIPEWLSGTLMRNGPVKIAINGESNSHLFDGLAMLHAFSFHDGNVSY